MRNEWVVYRDIHVIVPTFQLRLQTKHAQTRTEKLAVTQYQFGEMKQ